jgi:Skp family chaperone for outer membrane proteins
MKKILVFMVTLLLVASSAFAAGGRIAFVDTQTVFDKTKLGKKYQGLLKEYYESRKKILDLDADEIQKLRDDYGKQSAVLKPEARKEREESIGRKINDFESGPSSITSFPRRMRSSRASSTRR